MSDKTDTKDEAETKSPDEIREEIKQTREELGDTVEALGAKSDVKGQAKAKVEEVKGNVKESVSDFGAKAKEATPASAASSGEQLIAKVKANPAPVALAGALLLGYLIGKRAGG